MARPVRDATTMTNNWAAGMSGAGTKFVKGVQSVTDSPTAKAATADAQARYVAGTQQAVASGRMAAALNAVSLTDWQQACVAKAANLAVGAIAGKPKFSSAAQKAVTINQGIRDAVASMPKGGAANAAARAAKAIQMMMTGWGKAA